MPSKTKHNYKLQITNYKLKHAPKDWESRLIRPSLTLSLIALLVLLAASAFPEDQPKDWPMFRGSPSLTGISSAELPKALKLLWSFEAEDSIESSAAIVGNTVYVASMDASLYAIELSTGKLRWRFATSGPVQESSPCVQDGIVYVGDINGMLYAVDAASGKEIWTFETQAEIRSSPNFHEGRVYIGSYDQYLYCLEAKTGALIWEYATDGPVHATPTIDGENVYISGCDATFRAINISTGKQAFSINLNDYTGASAAISGGYAYVGTFGNEVLGLNLQKHLPEWSYAHPTRNFPFYSSAAIGSDRIVLGGRDKIVHCLDKSTGKEIWSFMTKARVESSPLVTGSRVFIGSNAGLFYEFDLISGKKVWEFTSGAPFSASPAAVHGFLVIGDQDGVLYCFGK
jgi:outer membrane protein assembly factor BamB